MGRPGRTRRARRLAGALLVAGGLVAVGDAAATVAWQEPLGALQSSHDQRKLDEEYDKLAAHFSGAGAGALRAPAAAASRAGGSRADAALRRASRRRLVAAARAANLVRARSARRLAAGSGEGAPLGRLRIPRIGLSKVWVQGTSSSSLAQAPGHYAGTALPGRHGTVGIAGHRTTHGAPFRHLDRLRRGDRIELSMPYGSYSYVVQGTRIVSPEQSQVLRSVRSDRLVLTACHPLWSARQRIVVTARLVRTPAPASAAAS